MAKPFPLMIDCMGKSFRHFIALPSAGSGESCGCAVCGVGPWLLARFSRHVSRCSVLHCSPNRRIVCIAAQLSRKWSASMPAVWTLMASAQVFNCSDGLDYIAPVSNVLPESFWKAGRSTNAIISCFQGHGQILQGYCFLWSVVLFR